MKLYDTTDAARQALTQKDVKEYFVIPDDYAASGMITIYTLEKQLTAPRMCKPELKTF